MWYLSFREKNIEWNHRVLIPNEKDRRKKSRKEAEDCGAPEDCACAWTEGVLQQVYHHIKRKGRSASRSDQLPYPNSTQCWYKSKKTKTSWIAA